MREQEWGRDQKQKQKRERERARKVLELAFKGSFSSHWSEEEEVVAAVVVSHYQAKDALKNLGATEDLVVAD